MNTESTLHDSELHPVLRELESSLHEGEFGVSISRLDAIKALDMARSSRERTTEDTLLSIGFKELIYNQGMKVADILGFIQDEFMLPYDRLFTIIKKDYSSIFGEDFEEELIEGLSKMDDTNDDTNDATNMVLQQIEITIEGEDESYIVQVIKRTYDGPSYKAIAILLMLKTIIDTNPGKKLLSIEFS